MTPRSLSALLILTQATQSIGFVAPRLASWQPYLQASSKLQLRVAAAPVVQARTPLRPSAVPPPPAGGAPPRGGLALSAGGLLATLVFSSSALSMAGTLATVSASFAAVFSFKLAKELSNLGVSKASVQQTVKNTFTATANLGVRTAVSLGVAAAYAVASVVSLVVWLLTRLGESVLFVAELTNRLKPSPDAPSPYPQLDTSGVVPAQPALASDAPPPASSTPSKPSPYLPRGFTPPSAAASPAARPADAAPASPQPMDYRNAASASAAYAAAQRGIPSSEAPPPPPPPPEEQVDSRDMGRALAIEQMLQRSSKAAAAARKMEVEKSTELKARQDEAVRKVFEQRRADRLSAPPPTKLSGNGGGPSTDLKSAYRNRGAAPMPTPRPYVRPPAPPPPSPSGGAAPSSYFNFKAAPSKPVAAAPAAARPLPPPPARPPAPPPADPTGKMDLSMAARMRQQRASPAPPPAAPAAPTAASGSFNPYLPRSVKLGGGGAAAAPKPAATPPTPPRAAPAPPPPPAAPAKPASPPTGGGSQWLPRGIKFNNPPSPPN